MESSFLMQPLPVSTFLGCSVELAWAQMEFGGKTWIRWPIGLIAVVLSFKTAFKVSQSGGMFSVGPLLVAVVLLIVAAVCFCPEVVRAVAAPLTRWIDSIYTPGGGRPDRAPLSFRLANYYVNMRQFDLAAAEYARILEDYPEEAEAYTGLVRLLEEELDDHGGARRWLKRGLRRVGDEEARAQLREEFSTLLQGGGHHLLA